MDFLLAMSIFSSAADVSREKAKAQEWIRAWVAGDDNKGAAAEQGKPRQRQDEQRAQKARAPPERKLKGRPWFAPEFDGLNCFETIVSH